MLPKKPYRYQPVATNESYIYPNIEHDPEKFKYDRQIKSSAFLKFRTQEVMSCLVRKFSTFLKNPRKVLNNTWKNMETSIFETVLGREAEDIIWSDYEDHSRGEGHFVLI